MKLTTVEKASLPSVIGFIEPSSKVVAAWFDGGIQSGEPLPDDIKSVEQAAQYLRSNAPQLPYPDGAISLASKLTEMIKGASTQPAKSEPKPIETTPTEQPAERPQVTVTKLRVESVTADQALLLFDVNPVVDVAVQIKSGDGEYKSLGNTGEYAKHKYKIHGQDDLLPDTDYTMRVTPIGGEPSEVKFKTKMLQSENHDVKTESTKQQQIKQESQAAVKETNNKESKDTTTYAQIIAWYNDNFKSQHDFGTGKESGYLPGKAAELYHEKHLGIWFMMNTNARMMPIVNKSLQTITFVATPTAPEDAVKLPKAKKSGNQTDELQSFIDKHPAGTSFVGQPDGNEYGIRKLTLKRAMNIFNMPNRAIGSGYCFVAEGVDVRIFSSPTNGKMHNSLNGAIDIKHTADRCYYIDSGLYNVDQTTKIFVSCGINRGAKDALIAGNNVHSLFNGAGGNNPVNSGAIVGGFTFGASGSHPKGNARFGNLKVFNNHFENLQGAGRVGSGNAILLHTNHDEKGVITRLYGNTTIDTKRGVKVIGRTNTYVFGHTHHFKTAKGPKGARKEQAFVAVQNKGCHSVYATHNKVILEGDGTYDNVVTVGSRLTGDEHYIQACSNDIEVRCDAPKQHYATVFKSSTKVKDQTPSPTPLKGMRICKNTIYGTVPDASVSYVHSWEGVYTRDGVKGADWELTGNTVKNVKINQKYTK